jgi:hypothetical protein
MSRDDYRKLIWTSHQKFPSGQASSYLEELVDDQDTDQVIELVETEVEYLDRGSEMADNFSIVRHEAQQSIDTNTQNFRFALTDLKGFVKQSLKQTIVGGALEGINEGMAEIQSLVSEQLPGQVETPKVRKTKKKPSGS